MVLDVSKGHPLSTEHALHFYSLVGTKVLENVREAARKALACCLFSKQVVLSVA